MKSGISLQARLLILVVAATLPLALLSVWSALRESESATEQAQTQLRLVASLMATNQDRAIESTRDLLSAISLMPGLRMPERRACEAYFQSLRGRFPIYANIGLAAPDGQVICHAAPGSTDFSIAQRDYFKRAMAQPGMALGESVVGTVVKRRVIPFALAVPGDDGKPAGVLFAALDIEQARQVLARAELPAGARVFIADRRAHILMVHPPSPGAIEGRLIPNPQVRAGAMQMVAGAGTGLDGAGQERIYAFAPSRLVGNEGFLAAVSIEAAQITQSSFNSLRDELAIVLLFTLLGATGAWWFGRRAFVNPARQIQEAVQRVEQGTLDARVPLDGWVPGSEFHRIAAAFNVMADSLELRQVDLQAELLRSRNAYTVLDAVLNSMVEGVVAANPQGSFMIYNDAALRMLDLDGPPVPQQDWPAHFGVYQTDRVTLCDPGELPLARALRGESGSVELFVRNALVPDGRLLQFNYRPMRGEGVGGGLVVFTDLTELLALQREQAQQFEELRTVQGRLVEAQHIGRIGNWELELPSRRLWWSDEVYKLFGVEQGEFGGEIADFLVHVHPDDRPLLDLARADSLVDGKPLDIEYRITKPDGTPAWMYELGAVRRDAQGRPAALAGVVQDITARKQTELALQSNERELQAYTSMLQHATNAAHAITSQQSVRATLEEVAAQARAVVGARVATARLLDAGDWTQGERAVQARIVDGKALCLRKQQLAAMPDLADFAGGNGVLAVMLRDGGPGIGMLLLADKREGHFSARDEYVALELAQLAAITIENNRLFAQLSELNASLESRIADRTAQLARQEALYRTLSEQAPEVVWNIDPSGRVTYLNRAWYELVGGGPDDWLGNKWMQRIHPEDLPSMSANWQHSRETLLPYTGTRRILGRDGRWHTTSYRASPILDPEGHVAFWVGIDSDITELKAIEQALRASNEELQAFSYSVSHDLRAPLGAIGGFSRALQHKLGEGADERSLHFLARIQAGVVKMEQLIDAMLSLAKVARAPLNYETVDISDLAHGAIEELQMQSPDRKVAVRIQENLNALGDTRLLRVVLQNLVGNAWKFTSQREDAQIEVGTRGGGVFFVRDNGAGFDMAYADKLFGAFQRLHTESEFPGTGIGLATVRRIIARHQGRVWAESQPGKGTTFFFSLSDKAPPVWLAGQDEKAPGAA